jgi:hypothetical protein
MRVAVARDWRSRRLEADEVASARGSGVGVAEANGVKEAEASKGLEAGPGGNNDQRRHGQWSGDLGGRRSGNPWWTAAGGGASADGAQPEEVPAVVECAGQQQCVSREAAAREMGGVAARPDGWRRAADGGVVAQPDRHMKVGGCCAAA